MSSSLGEATPNPRRRLPTPTIGIVPLQHRTWGLTLAEPALTAEILTDAPAEHDVHEPGVPSPSANADAESDDLSSLLARFADEDDDRVAERPPSASKGEAEETTGSSPDPNASSKETEPARPTCPAGIPQPKINFAALKKAKAEREGEAGRKSLSDVLEAREPEVSTEKPPAPLPRWLLALDETTLRLQQVHPRLPMSLGIAGICALLNGSLIIVLAALGWI